MRILINGCGIAGATLAWWLRRFGHDVVLVERAPQLRTGGYVIDFWGVGYDVAEKMGLRSSLHEMGYTVRELRLVDRHGRVRGGLSTDALRDVLRGRFTTIRRSDLATLIYRALPQGVDRVFGDSVTSLEDVPEGVRVRLERALPRTVDVVVGADGLHSRVRDLLFKGAPSPEVSLGYHVAAFEAIGYRPRDELAYVTHGVPGRQVSRLALRDDVTLFLLVVHDEHLRAETARDLASQKSVLRDAFHGVGWECSRILDAMDAAPQMYFDRVSQIHLPCWHTDHIALIGDAAAAVSLLAGEGTGLAMVEAYILAGELHAASDPAEGFERYESLLRPFLDGKQTAASRFASTFAPRSEWGVMLRYLAMRLLRMPWLARRVVGRSLRDDFCLPDYATDC
jgi:2-polyprenyl-6-methoxyphenol hydroxylase-like FAD-dependent oxidoreductase